MPVPRIGPRRSFHCPEHLWNQAFDAADFERIPVSEWIRRAMAYRVARPWIPGEWEDAGVGTGMDEEKG